MTYFPDYLKTYPNMDTASPLHMSLNTLEAGFRAHRHDYLEFSYVVEGSGSESINGKLHPMRPGTFTFVLPYQVHQIYTDKGSKLVLFNCMFSMSLLMDTSIKSGINRLTEMIHAPSYVLLDGEEKLRFDRLVREMFIEFSNNEDWRDTMLVIRVKELLVRFDRIRQSTYKPIMEQPIISLKRNEVWPIIHYIYQHYQENVTLASLSTKFSISVSRLSEVIKEVTGQNFNHFLNDLRLRHACSLLVSTDMSVSEIAMEVGYGSYNTFSRVFRANKGIVPKEYRKLNK